MSVTKFFFMYIVSAIALLFISIKTNWFHFSLTSFMVGWLISGIYYVEEIQKYNEK